MPEDIKVKYFVTPYAPDCRKRHEHHRYKNKIVEFIVQKVEKVRIPNLDYKEALTYAEEDLNENWQIYRSRYLKGVFHD